MSLINERRAQVFPILTPAHRENAARFASGPAETFSAGAPLFALGERNVPAYLVLDGSVVVSRQDVAGRDSLRIEHAPGSLTGEVAQLSGRPTLAAGEAGLAGCTVLPFDAPHLRALVVGSAEIGEIVMRAFILRRSAMIVEGRAGAVLIGTSGDPALVRLQGFLSRNSFPHTVLDPLGDPDAAALIERLAIAASDLPIMLCPNGALLKRPSEAEAGACLGVTPELPEGVRYDVAVVGAGPAGLATAVYAASEGLSVLVLDTRAFGGQAGASARIENYFGFPTGITGQALTARAFGQALKFGAEVAIPLEVARLDCAAAHAEGVLGLDLADGRRIAARTVVIASGARYRRPDIAGLDRFEGAGVSYWASPVEAKLCAGEEVALVGAGNSAGQAVVYLAARVSRLHLVVRGHGLEASMSRYLIDRIEALPNVVLHTRKEVVELSGDADDGGRLAAATFRHRDTGEQTTCALRHLFLFIGADPNTSWLDGCHIAIDEKGFVLTGDGAGAPVSTASAPGRPLMPLETNVPGVYAIGDVRAGSTKRVAAAVGEGAAVVALIHGHLAERSAPPANRGG